MIKKEKGVTVASLLIVVSLMTIISAAVVNLSLNRFEINKLKKMFNDIELLQDKVSNYYLKYGILPVLNNNENLSSILSFEKNTGDNNVYYILDLEAMDGIALNYGKEGYEVYKSSENPSTSDDVYIINEKSHIIYYAKGKELNGTTYHTLVNNTSISDTIPPSSPEIKVVSGTKSGDTYITNVEVEIIAGKDGGSEVPETMYSLDGTTWETFTEASKLITITESGEYTIKAKTIKKSENTSENGTENASKIAELTIKLELEV